MKKFGQQILTAMYACGVISIALGGAFAATTDNGCGKDSNDRINPEIALCSTHVYNIGEVENPSTESDKQLMRDVVALKSTVMTQQMYKQYEYLDATLKRFKTQLEKAVLTTKLMAAGADISSAGGSSYSGVSTGSSSTQFRSSDRNIFIAGVSNCNNELTPAKVYECLHANANTIYNSSNNGENVTSELKKQLANDYALVVDTCDTKVCDPQKVKDFCKKYNTISTRQNFRECLDSLRNLIRLGNADVTKSQNMMNRSNLGG